MPIASAACLAVLLAACGSAPDEGDPRNGPIPTPVPELPYPSYAVDAHAWTVHVSNDLGMECDGSGTVALVDDLDLVGSWTGTCGDGVLEMHVNPGIQPQLMRLTIGVSGVVPVCERVARLEGQWMACTAYPPDVTTHGYAVLLRAQ